MVSRICRQEKEAGMILGETPQQKQDRYELEDSLRRLNRGQRDYVDQFTTIGPEELVQSARETLNRLPKCLRE